MKKIILLLTIGVCVGLHASSNDAESVLPRCYEALCETVEQRDAITALWKNAENDNSNARRLLGYLLRVKVPEGIDLNPSLIEDFLPIEGMAPLRGVAGSADFRRMDGVGRRVEETLDAVFDETPGSVLPGPTDHTEAVLKELEAAAGELLDERAIEELRRNFGPSLEERKECR